MIENKDENIKESYYAVLPYFVLYDNSLMLGAKVIYASISALANQKGYCYASNNYFCQKFGISERQVRNWLTNLIDKQYIIREIIYQKDTKIIQERRLYIVTNLAGDLRKNSIPTAINNRTPTVKKCRHLRLKSAEVIDKVNNININNNSPADFCGDNLEQHSLIVPDEIPSFFPELSSEDNESSSNTSIDTTIVNTTIEVIPESKKQSKEKAPNKVEFDFTDFTDKEIEAIKQWLEYKKEIKSPLKSKMGMTALRNQLIGFKSNTYDIPAIITNVMASGNYRGLFVPSHLTTKYRQEMQKKPRRTTHLVEAMIDTDSSRLVRIMRDKEKDGCYLAFVLTNLDAKEKIQAYFDTNEIYEGWKYEDLKHDKFENIDNYFKQKYGVKKIFVIDRS